MTDEQQIGELKEMLQQVTNRWCPEFSLLTETVQQQQLRALLQLNAYTMDADRVLKGERPIRTIYPLPLPGLADLKLVEALKSVISAIERGELKIVGRTAAFGMSSETVRVNEEATQHMARCLAMSLPEEHEPAA
jgi:hypothetical protein